MCCLEKKLLASSFRVAYEKSMAFVLEGNNIYGYSVVVKLLLGCFM